MIRTIIGYAIRRMERQFGYDASYLHHILRVSPATSLKFSIASGLVDLKAAPSEALAAAGLVATRREDCGPCVQISADLALSRGVKPEILAAIVRGDLDAMGESASLAFRFALACLERDMIVADPLRDEILHRWGEKGLVAISMSIWNGRMYPTLKYALGYGKTCSQVKIQRQVVQPFTLEAAGIRNS